MKYLTTVLAILLLAGCERETRPLTVSSLSDERAAAIADSIRETVSVDVAEGLELTLWAPEHLVQDPIALAFDNDGAAWITRTIRQKNSEFDIRGYPQWMVPSIRLESVEERRAFLRDSLSSERSDQNRWLADLNADSLHDWRDLMVEKERAYFIQDTSGDGLADRSQLYIEDFNEEITDIAGAVLPVDGDVYLGVAPDMWRLRDTDGDGMADVQTSISHGYGVHIGFSGHNISGLTRGPDGRLYWSIGDIGFNVVDQDGTRWSYPHQGAIFRSELDGSGFEVFAHGLRNTHEFMFDKHGNLISVDNDADHAGERERIVYIINGSDSGWRTHWQFGKYMDPDNNGYKVWMDEGLHRPRFEGQAAYLLPPVASYHSGPAGMAYNPGTGLSPRWQDHFFMSEFVGSASRSRIWAFQLAPSGAGFEFAGETLVARGILTTGIDFGPDGALYVADWIAGWDTNDQGRIWKFDVPGGATSAERIETRDLLEEDFRGRTESNLASLLGHADQRVRMKAQFTLVDRVSTSVLRGVARSTQSSTQPLARLHAIWGIGQLARRDAPKAALLTELLSDDDAEVRAQAARVLGDVRFAEAAPDLLPLLADDAPRVRFFATEALGRLGHRPALEPILAMLEANDDEDTYLRHGGMVALARIGDPVALVALNDHSSRALRIAAVVALRRLGHEGVAVFLDDADPYVVTEAARAINDDESIPEALPALARVLESHPEGNEALLRRALNANLRLGAPEQAQAVAAFAARPGVSPPMQAEALAILGVWPRPSVLDRVDGVDRGDVSHDPQVARDALAPVIAGLLSNSEPMSQVAAADAAARLELGAAAPALRALLTSAPDPDVRTAALKALAAVQADDVEGAVRQGLADASREVRMAALGLVAELPLSEAGVAELLGSVLEAGAILEQQTALTTLGSLGTEPSEQMLASVMDDLEAGTLNPALQIEATEAIEQGGGEALTARLATYREATPTYPVPENREQLLATYGGTLFGGNSEAGARVAFQNSAAQCARCHSFGDWGGDVGPDLVGVASRMTREELLESIVAPSITFSPGYGTVTLTLDDDSIVRGLLTERSATAVTVRTSEGQEQSIPNARIAEERFDPSAMPPMGLVLSRREIRDLVAFMATME